MYIEKINQAIEDAVGEIVQPLQSALDSANSSLSQAQADASNLRSQVATYQGQIVDLTAQLNLANQTAANKDAQIAGLNNQITSLAAQIADLKAQIAALQQQGNITPTGTAIESVPQQGSLTATIRQIKGDVAFKPQTYEFGTFDGSAVGFFPWVDTTGIHGSGVSKTVFQMKANSATSTQIASVPTGVGTTNQYQLMRVGGAGPNSKGVAVNVPVTLSDFTLQGTTQGMLYNGLQLYYASGAVLSNVRIAGIPGNSAVNPGETFGVNVYHSDNVVFNNVEVDGSIGGSNVGLNFVNGFTLNDSYLHDAKYGAGITGYTSTGNIIYNRVRAINNRYVAFNFEQCNAANITLNNCIMQGSKGAHIIIDSSVGSSRLTIVDPVFDGPKLLVTVHAKYADGKANLQKDSDITLIVNGQSRPDLMTIQRENQNGL